jgi:cytochrome c oxidase subunit 2
MPFAAGGGLTPAGAAEPMPWQFGFQPAASPITERVTDLHDLLLWIITGIMLFVLVLLAYACWRFRESRNPVPSKRTHHTLLEIAWTALPVLILVVIAIPSFKLLYYQERPPEIDMTIKAIGRQWYWTYEYPDHGNFVFDAYMVPPEEIQGDQKRLLDVDNRVVLPVETNIRVLVTGSDVIHSWFVPALGMKKDAIPGRLNELWFRIERPGTYYGQCYELCGAYHPFMPIVVEAVTAEQFEAWVQEAQQRFARADDAGFEVAAQGPEHQRPR